MLTKLHKLLYEEQSFDAFRATIVRYGIALIGIVVMSPPAPIAALIGEHPTAGLVIAFMSVLIAAGNKNQPPA